MSGFLFVAATLTMVGGGTVSSASTLLVEWPVIAAQVVAPVEYAQAAARAPRGASPLDIALSVVGPFEGSMQHIVQANEGTEAPVRVRLTVIRDGLLDDSVRAMRWDIVLDRRGTNAWTITEVRRAWSCRRAASAQRFDTARCP